jgi:uncharacterized protein YndB with AHSA1/START domain
VKLELTFEELFSSPIEVVWHAVTDPRMLGRWLMHNDFEPRPGHKFTLRDPPTATWRGWFECEVLELDPPRRMTWAWHGGMPGEVTTRVIFELHPEGAATRLVLRHVGDATPKQAEATRDGWTRKLASLRHALGPDYARRVAFAAQRDRVFDAIATLDGLRGWWPTPVRGSAARGGELRLGVGCPAEPLVVRIDRFTPPAALRWTCVASAERGDCEGSTVTFELAHRAGEGCELTIRHIGPPHAACGRDAWERVWDRLVRRLVAHVDGGGDASSEPDQRLPASPEPPNTT